MLWDFKVSNKRYQASFIYYNPDRDPVSFMDAMLDKLSDRCTEEQLTILKEYNRAMAETPEEDHETLQT